MSMVVGDKITKVIGIENEGLKRLFLYIYKIGLVSLILLFLGSVITVLITGIDEYKIILVFLIGLGLLLWTPVYLLILMIGFRLFINPILFIIEGFKNEKK